MLLLGAEEVESRSTCYPPRPSLALSAHVCAPKREQVFVLLCFVKAVVCLKSRLDSSFGPNSNNELLIAQGGSYLLYLWGLHPTETVPRLRLNILFKPLLVRIWPEFAREAVTGSSQSCQHVDLSQAPRKASYNNNNNLRLTPNVTQPRTCFHPSWCCLAKPVSAPVEFSWSLELGELDGTWWQDTLVYSYWITSEYKSSPVLLRNKNCRASVAGGHIWPLLENGLGQKRRLSTDTSGCSTASGHLRRVTGGGCLQDPTLTLFVVHSFASCFSPSWLRCL